MWNNAILMGINEDSWGLMDRMRTLLIPINTHESPLIPMRINGRKLIPMNPHSVDYSLVSLVSFRLCYAYRVEVFQCPRAPIAYSEPVAMQL